MEGEDSTTKNNEEITTTPVEIITNKKSLESVDSSTSNKQEYITYNIYNYINSVNQKKVLMILISKYFRIYKGYERLIYKHSTGYFGNWGIHSAILHLNLTYHCSIRSIHFMGISKYIPSNGKVKKSDTDEVIENQWNLLIKISFFFNLHKIIFLIVFSIL